MLAPKPDVTQLGFRFQFIIWLLERERALLKSAGKPEHSKRFARHDTHAQ